MTLQTDRLILRPWREEDAEVLYSYAKDPDIGYPAGWPAHTSVENSRNIIQNVFSQRETYALCRKEEDAPIGCIALKLGDATDLTDRPDECELGYWLGKPFWGQGLIPEAARELIRHAFETLGMTAIWCGYYDGNTKSRRVQEKVGFRFHHTSQGVEVPLLGEYRTGHVSRLTKAQWEADRQ
ncbi:MAG: GNAT family N-acetyltransferase [Ruminococcaceae bacterium]|nr:GNAT family N-acetyltransferase [Oscillospiraceae bacterium]